VYVPKVKPKVAKVVELYVALLLSWVPETYAVGKKILEPNPFIPTKSPLEVFGAGVVPGTPIVVGPVIPCTFWPLAPAVTIIVAKSALISGPLLYRTEAPKPAVLTVPLPEKITFPPTSVSVNNKAIYFFLINIH
jgi:hypothetical protein